MTTITVSQRGFGYIEERLTLDELRAVSGRRLVHVELADERADEMIGHLDWWADALRWETEAEPKADRAALLRDVTRNRKGAPR